MKKIIDFKYYLIASTIWAILWQFFATPNFADGSLLTPLFLALLLALLIMILPLLVYVMYYKMDKGKDSRAKKFFKITFKGVFFILLLLLFSSIKTNFLNGVNYFLPIMTIVSFYILKKIK